MTALRAMTHTWSFRHRSAAKSFRHRIYGMAARNKRQAARCSKRSFITVMAPVSTTITALATISGMSPRSQP